MKLIDKRKIVEAVRDQYEHALYVVSVDGKLRRVKTGTLCRWALRWLEERGRGR